MSSDRLSTSIPAEYTESTTQDTTNISAPKPQQYIPHIFDLITPTHRARDLTKLFIPAAYLQSEAVDASLLLGHGASFTASRQSLPAGEEFLIEKVDMGGWTIEKKSPAPRRPKYLVYKSARVSFDESGEPSTPRDRRALQSVLTEFHALLHPPLLNHPHIIDFLGLAWGSNPFKPRHKLPVLVVEYADHGTLADLQAGQIPLSEKIKLDLCTGIAQGLSALHSNNVVHGDVKPENVLICSHEKTTYIAKLADFGFAIIEAAESTEISIGGTRTWRAPETSSIVSKAALRKTDVYSFGLLAWSLAIDGGDPFSLMVTDGISGEGRFAEIDNIKNRDEVIQLSNFDHWVFRWKMMGEHSLLSNSGQGNSRQLISLLADPVRMQKALETLPDQFSEQATLLVAKRNEASSKFCELLRGKLFYKDLESLFLKTLSKDPEKRDLAAVMRILEDEKNVQG